MLESKLKDIRKYIWVEGICHGWAEIDWDTFSKISKNRTILDFFSDKPTTKWRNSSLFWQLHNKKLFWAGLVSKQRSFQTTNFCLCYVMEIKFENLDPLRWSDMSAKMIPSLEILHKNRAEFAGCLHEEHFIIWEVSCCFPCFMFTLHIKQGYFCC